MSWILTYPPSSIPGLTSSWLRAILRSVPGLISKWREDVPRLVDDLESCPSSRSGGLASPVSPRRTSSPVFALIFQRRQATPLRVSTATSVLQDFTTSRSCPVGRGFTLRTRKTSQVGLLVEYLFLAARSLAPRFAFLPPSCVRRSAHHPHLRVLIVVEAQLCPRTRPL